jgi:hypothetical protein
MTAVEFPPMQEERAAVTRFLNRVCALSNFGRAALGCAWMLTATSAAHSDQIEIRTIAQQLPLPQTYDMKLAGDLDSYIRLKCAGFAAQCDVFVQASNRGSLIGYLFIRQESNGSVYFESDTTNLRHLGEFRWCTFRRHRKLRTDGTFQAKTGGQDQADKGGYLIKRDGDSLRVQDDKWNYCYGTKRIDDIWNLVGTARRR